MMNKHIQHSQCRWSDNASSQGISSYCRDQSRYVPSQWEMLLHCNDISHWLGAYLDWSLNCLPRARISHSSTISLSSNDIKCEYLKTSNISHTKSQNLNDSCLILQLSLPIPLKPGVKSRMKMYLEQHWQAMLHLHWSDQEVGCLLMYALY